MDAIGSEVTLWAVVLLAIAITVKCPFRIG